MQKYLDVSQISYDPIIVKYILKDFRYAYLELSEFSLDAILDASNFTDYL
jgi:hypothetical protein